MKRIILFLILVAFAHEARAQSPVMPFAFWKTSAPTTLPSDIDSLYFWFKADAITGKVDGDTCWRWPDSKPGSVKALWQTTAAKVPVYKTNIVNGKPVLRFDGVDDYIYENWYSATYKPQTSAEIFIVSSIVADPPAISGKTGFIDAGSTAQATHHPYTDGVIYDGAFTDTRKTVGNPTPSLTSMRVYEVLSIAGEWTASLDSAQLYTTATNVVGWSGVFAVGSNVYGSPLYFMDGDFAEIIIYNRRLKSSERSAIYAYLKNKYALSY